MSRTSLVTILVFVAGLGIGYFAQSAAGMLQRRTHVAHSVLACFGWGCRVGVFHCGL